MTTFIIFTLWLILAIAAEAFGVTDSIAGMAYERFQYNPALLIIIQMLLAIVAFPALLADAIAVSIEGRD